MASQVADELARALGFRWLHTGITRLEVRAGSGEQKPEAGKAASRFHPRPIRDPLDSPRLYCQSRQLCLPIIDLIRSPRSILCHRACQDKRAAFKFLAFCGKALVGDG